MRQIILYGFGGAQDQYRVIRYFVLDEECMSIRSIDDAAWMMQVKYPSIESVYAIDNRYGLRKEYIESIKKNSIESCAIFKDIVERDGLRVR